MTIYAGEYVRISTVPMAQPSEGVTELLTPTDVDGDVTIWDATEVVLVADAMTFDEDAGHWYYDWETSGQPPGKYLVRCRFVGHAHKDSWEYVNVTLKKDKAPGTDVYEPGWRLKTGFPWRAPVAIVVEEDGDPVDLTAATITLWARPRGAVGVGTLQLGYDDSSLLLGAGKIVPTLEGADTDGKAAGLWEVELVVTLPGEDPAPSENFLILLEESITP